MKLNNHNTKVLWVNPNLFSWTSPAQACEVQVHFLVTFEQPFPSSFLQQKIPIKIFIWFEKINKLSRNKMKQKESDKYCGDLQVSGTGYGQLDGGRSLHMWRQQRSQSDGQRGTSRVEHDRRAGGHWTVSRSDVTNR